MASQRGRRRKGGQRGAANPAPRDGVQGLPAEEPRAEDRPGGDQDGAHRDSLPEGVSPADRRVRRQVHPGIGEGAGRVRAQESPLSGTLDRLCSLIGPPDEGEAFESYWERVQVAWRAVSAMQSLEMGNPHNDSFEIIEVEEGRFSWRRVGPGGEEVIAAGRAFPGHASALRHMARAGGWLSGVHAVSVLEIPGDEDEDES